MASRDIVHNVGVVQAIAPAAADSGNTAIVGAIVDTAGFESVALVLNIGALGTDAATFATTLEHGDDPALADTSAPATTDLVGSLSDVAFTGTDDNKTKKIGYIGSKRYLRMTVTPSGNAAAAYISAVAVLGHARNKPSA